MLASTKLNLSVLSHNSWLTIPLPTSLSNIKWSARPRTLISPALVIPNLKLVFAKILLIQALSDSIVVAKIHLTMSLFLGLFTTALNVIVLLQLQLTNLAHVVPHQMSRRPNFNQCVQLDLQRLTAVAPMLPPQQLTRTTTTAHARAIPTITPILI